MTIQIRERTVGEIDLKVESMQTPLNKIAYLESALKESGFTFEVKRFILLKLVELYEGRKMFEKAGKAMANKAGMDISFPDKIESYLRAAELFAKSGRVDEADEMFVRALRDANDVQRQKIKLARKNIFKINADELEKRGKRVGAVKFYEKLVKMNLDDIEKEEIKRKLVDTYRAMGRFRDAELIGGM
jgi:tetratricopeptide (TPR) repeat protein